MSYLRNYDKIIRNLINNFNEKNKPVINEIEIDIDSVDPLSTLLTSEKIWLDGFNLMQLNEFFALSLVGPQGSGKSSIAKQIANFAKKKDFKIIYAMPEDYMSDITAWLELAVVNPRFRVMIILDDLSYGSDALGKKNQALLKNMVARIRHIFKAQIFMIYITHRLHATPPMLRNSSTWIFTNMQSADRDDALEVIGRAKEVRDRLEDVYLFISRVTLESANDRMVKYYFNGKEYFFKWGDKTDKGDGRLMAIYHGGKLKLFRSIDTDEVFNFEDYRFIPIPKPKEDLPQMRKRRNADSD